MAPRRGNGIKTLDTDVTTFELRARAKRGKGTAEARGRMERVSSHRRVLFFFPGPGTQEEEEEEEERARARLEGFVGKHSCPVPAGATWRENISRRAQFGISLIINLAMTCDSFVAPRFAVIILL